MPSRETQRALLEELCRGGLLENPRVLSDAELGATWASGRGIVAALEGDITRANSETIRLRVGLCRRFPAVLPRIFVHPPADWFGRIPHVERDGYVCFLADEGVIIDRSDLRSALERCVELAADVLETARSTASRADVLREFEAYWRQLPHAMAFDSYVAPFGEPRKLVAYCHPDRKYAFVADDERAVRAYKRKVPALTKRNALYVPLERSVLEDPPEPEVLVVLDRLRDYVQHHCSPTTRRGLLELTAKWKTEELLVLCLPRPDAGHILAGVLVRGLQTGHPLGSGTTSVPLIPVSFDRRDREAVMARGGAATDLTRRRMLVVGCGAVGSHAAVGLAHAGFGHLTLVDPDTIKPENAFRHAVGVAGDGEAKVDALRAEIERRIPFIDVVSHRGHIELLLESKSLSFADFDGVLVAVGAPTLELILNEVLWTAAPTNAVFTWLEPEGIGGHALLARSLQPNVRGCVSCLYEPAEAGGPLRNRADFAAPGQSFVRDHIGCGGRFTMFSALDARRTADLAVELMLGAVDGTVDGHPLRSWKGDPRRFKSSGYALSPRYELSSERLNELACSYQNDACKICANT